MSVEGRPTAEGTNTGDLIAVLREARALLERVNNNFAWSGWDDGGQALREVDTLISRLVAGDRPRQLDLWGLFAPTGNVQEVSLCSGWSEEYMRLAGRFDLAMIQDGYKNE